MCQPLYPILKTMKLFRDKETFKIHTNLDSDEIIERLNIFVDFEHKGNISTFLIEKEYYGNIVNDEFIKIWKKPAISGFMDKGFAPTIELSIKEGEINVNVQDYLLIILLVFCGSAVLSAGILISEGIAHPDFRELLWFGLLILSFPLIGFGIERKTFFGTIEDIQKRLKKLEK